MIHQQVVNEAGPDRALEKKSFLQTSSCKNPKYYFTKHLFLFQVNSAGLEIFNLHCASAVFISLGDINSHLVTVFQVCSLL